MKNKGITLIALVITIIILLILAGVTIATLTGDDGILNKASKAISEQEKATMKEELELKLMELRMDYETDQNLKTKYPTIADYIKEKLDGYKFSNGSEIKYDKENDKFLFEIGGGEASFNINENGDLTDLRFPETISSGNRYDTIAPAVSIVSTTTNSITFYATDAVGIIGYAISQNNEIPTEWEEITKTQELEKTVTGLINNETYYIWAKDEAGNISEVQTAKTIDFESFQHTISWSGSTATITVTSPSSGVQYRVGSEGSWNKYTVPIPVESGITVQFIITDGNNTTTATSVTPRLTSLQLSYDANTGTGSVPTSQEYTHDDNVTVSFTTLPSKTGYTFHGWSTNQNASSAEYTATGNNTFKMPARNVTLYAVWIPNTGTAYTVIHRQMNVNGSDYTTVETENLTGTTGASITPAVKRYTGFTAPSTQTTTIMGDGSTIVTYDYKRNQYTFTLGTATGINTTGSSLSGKYYYGETITLKANVDSKHIWKQWIGSASRFSTITKDTTIIMPEYNLEMTPSCSEILRKLRLTSKDGDWVEYELLDNDDISVLGGWNTEFHGTRQGMSVNMEFKKVRYSSISSI